MTFSVTVIDGTSAKVLVDHPDPRRDRIARRAEAHGLPWTWISPSSGLYSPREDFHQGALAGTVLAEQGVHLARRRSKSTWSFARTPGTA
jgi:hypothetical protein